MRKIFIPALFALALTGCGDSAPEKSAASEAGNSDQAGSAVLTGKVRLDGSSTVFPISEAIAEEFGAVAPKVRVTVGVSGTGGGFKKFINQETDISDASRPIKDSEHDKATAAGVDFIELPVAYDGISVVLNLENDWVDHLTVEELNKIWAPDSTVTTWKDVRDGWPDEPIRLYGPGTDSGTFDYFTGVINGKEQASRGDFTASEDDNVLVQGISGDKYSLGYFGFAYYIENQDKLRAAPIEGPNGIVSPTEVTINDGTYAPLSRPIFIYVNVAALDKPEVAAFIDFYLETAPKIASEVGYIPMPESVYDGAKNRVKNRITGSAYNKGATLERLVTH
ncbi:MAG: PstS family phosphate ABC transporter substrate-binding protein [Pseudomonadales bacterium]|nr:PstS family phosphate ABC transporter substrate-binding protein [Pseudomonadales bacterium]